MSTLTTWPETEWLVSQRKEDMRPGDETLPERVRLAAMIEANRIIADVLPRGSTIVDGRICVSAWSVHRLALRIAEIAEKGLEDGL